MDWPEGSYDVPGPKSLLSPPTKTGWGGLVKIKNTADLNTRWCPTAFQRGSGAAEGRDSFRADCQYSKNSTLTVWFEKSGRNPRRNNFSVNGRGQARPRQSLYWTDGGTLVTVKLDSFFVIGEYFAGAAERALQVGKG